jgi:hypothetical protein
MGQTSTQGFVFKLVANDTILDLFADEDIKLSDNVTGLFDLGVLPTDFTRQIQLPGTKKNNAFFEHVYDISVFSPDTFATNIKVPAYLDFDGLYLAQGYLQLNKVNVFANKFIDSYEVTIFGALSSFGITVNKNYLTDLTPLNTYNHTASIAAVTSSWSGSLFNGDIIYPLADYGSALQFTSGQYELFGMDDYQGALSTIDFKPAIRMKKVWDAIFDFAGYTYTSSFFNEPFLDDVYLLCNNSLQYPEFAGVDLEGYGRIKVGAISGSGMTDIKLTENTFVTLPWYNKLSDPQDFYNNGAYRLEVSSSLKGILNININVSCSVNNMPGTLTQNGTWQYQLIETGSGTPYSLSAIQSYIFYFDQLQQSRTGAINQNFELQTEFATNTQIPPGNYYFQIKQRPNFAAPTVQPIVTLDPLGTTKSYLEIKKVNQAADGRIMNIPLNMPFGTTGIKLIDFIKGIQKKFNLVIYPSKTVKNQFIVETFNTWYKQGTIKDFNKYINLDDKIEVIPANNLAVNELNFGDTLDQDYISQQFSKAANREYGKSYFTDTNNFFSQGKFEVKTTLASSPLIKIAGTGLSGSIAGIAPQPAKYNAGYYRFTNESFDPGAACNSYISFNIYTDNGTVNAGQTAYYDEYGTNIVYGYNYFTSAEFGGGAIYEISNANGVIGYNVGNC